VDTVIQITTTSGTANGLDDYVNTTVTATIPAFQSEVNVSIPIIDDTVSEPPEVFSVNGTVVSGNTSNTDPSGTVTITDDDDSFVSIGDVNISESDGTASVPVSIAGPSAVDTVISITTTDGSATDPDDYASLTVMVTIPAFQTSTSVSIPIIDDAISEPTEDFTVNGTVVSGNTSNISPSGTVNIIDDDQVIFVINDISVMEDAGSITVPVTIQGVSSIDTNINITTTNDTATSPDDYTSVMTTVTIPALQSSINVVIPIIDDDVFETAEAFFIQGTVITGNTVNANDIATVSIIDDGSCGGGNIVGAPCDDGDPATLSDFIDENCNCIGEATEDVDGDGILNIEEVFNGTDYTDPCDPVQDIGYTGFDADNTVWQAGNCDNDDLNNALEIILGTDPYNTNYNTIQGNIAYDLNDDGCNGTDDLVFPFTRVDINDGTETTSIFTDNLGNYSFQATSGNYTITPNIENPTLYIATPANAIANFPITNNLLADEDFCITNNGSNPDVEIVISPIDFARPGFDASYWISYKNKGNEVISGDISLTYDEPLLDFINSTETISSQTPGVLNWTYTDLAPLESRNFYVRFNVNSPTETPPVNIDDQLVFTATINPIAGDILPDDNQFAYTQTVVGSYDPNDITCIQGNFVNPDQIGEYLHYVINFENTGNFFAQNVVVEMEIDPTQFNASTIRMLSTSHDASITVTGNIIRFIFQNILLEAGGHGNILLKIQSQDTLIEDDIVSNEANIFFDYNFPIQTNTETTAFTLSLDQVRLNNAINIYPNPTKEQLYISAKDAIKSIEIYDVQGRMLASEKYNTKNIALDMSAQAAGIYFVKIKTEKGIKTEKIVKM
ncbi:MAG: Calx-beta domain-containing protein, partial [Kordia sp.]|uniref:DUF7619 domain-containing protein n=1 Tax=Kordia sp. TaxID=1965332 RepID=UPI0038587D4D